MSDTETLRHLGSQGTEYPTQPSKDILDFFKNQHPNNLYLVPFTMERDEFTSLCPKTGQPDQAKMEIVYVPNEKMVESKSLKLYLFSFRNTGEFHEDVCNRIANDIFDLLQPKYLRVYGDFSPRGGIAIKPLVEKWEKADERDRNIYLIRDNIRRLVDMFDVKKAKPLYHSC